MPTTGNIEHPAELLRILRKGEDSGRGRDEEKPSASEGSAFTSGPHVERIENVREGTPYRIERRRVSRKLIYFFEEIGYIKGGKITRRGYDGYYDQWLDDGLPGSIGDLKSSFQQGRFGP